MSWLLDTNVISEWTKPKPNPSVSEWLSAVDEDEAFLSVVTLAEIRHGIERLPAGQRRNLLHAWLQRDVGERFEGRVIPVDDAIAHEWGVVVAKRERAGRPIGVIDAFMAATANVRGLRLATRNANDFTGAATSVFNPWSGRA